MSAPSRRAAVFALAGLAAVALAGCTRDAMDYPAGWAPLIVSGQRCPSVSGDYVLDPAAGRDAALGELTRPAFASPDAAGIPPQIVRIASDDGQGRMAVSFARRPQPGAPIDWQQYRVDVHGARCEAGLLEIERHDTRGGWTALRLGKDTDGKLVAQRLDNRSSPLLRWGDGAGFLSTRATHASWGRWTPGDVTELRPRQATPTPAAASSPAAAPAPAPAPTRPGSMALGEAQAIVFAALPDSATFRGMTSTPDGYELHVATEDPHAVERLTQRLLKEGHFAVRPGARFAPASTPAPAPASDASAPEPAPAPTRTGADLTLNLVERGLR